ncbi:ABC transporter ATP-binding protein [Enterovirga sp.]|uniref:ABC transporter ATP-binding protein n=1 Tax=Enterovirga sp. TaxID=2026350 RepID=UPI002C090470|nr:ABC transporter ATP-binding protein [Enterovirga sp.]HMO29719.1 ABC transporter ATP-binding protein [Enterovirga sp.]
MTQVPARSPAELRIEGVDLSYGDNHVLKNVSLAVEPGELFAFLGPSGCGKTTLLRLIAGFNQADRGRVLVDGADISGLPPWRRDVGLVFQSYALWPHMTVAQNVAFGLEERRLPRAEVARRTEAALALVGLGTFASRRPSQLSGGQQQRVALARTLAVEPKLLLLDEPLSNLDAQLRVQVRRELREMQQRLGLTTIFVTHDQEEANTICDRIAVMRDGIVQQVGTPVELYERPSNLFVARFLGSLNALSGPLPEGLMAPKAGLTPVFRPQDAVMGGGEGLVGLTGRVKTREFLGATIRYALAAPQGEIMVDTPFRAGARLEETGAELTIGVPPAAFRWLAD